HKDGCCFIITHILAAKYVAIASAVLQRNPPLPTSCTSSGAGIGNGVCNFCAGHGNGPVAWQKIRPIVVTGFQCLFDQQAAKPGAINKEITVYSFSAFQYNRFNKSFGRE